MSEVNRDSSAAAPDASEATTPATTAITATTAAPTTAAEQANNATTTEVEVLPDDEPDSDSVMGQSVAYSTISLTSSVLRFRIENGRTYHSYKEGKYSLPNDDKENDRLDAQHNMFLLSFDGRLGTSPPAQQGAKVGRVLDVGTGTGVWAMDYGEEHPEAEIIGVDLSPIQPDFVYPNVKFEIDDIEEPWTYSEPFDYIHSRMMTTSIQSWREYFQKCYDNLVPGGYLELNEIDLKPRSDDGTLSADSHLVKFSRLWGEAAAKFGRPFLEDFGVLIDVLAEVGFEDIHAKKFKWPSGPWAKDPKYKELGAWNLENMVANLEGLMMAPLTRAHNWTKEEVTVLAMHVRREMTDRSIHSYSTIWSIYGRKPAAVGN